MQQLRSQGIFLGRVRLNILLTALGIALAACAGPEARKTEKYIYSSGRTIYKEQGNEAIAAVVWDAGEYGHVRIVPAEDAAQAPNDHPVTLAPEQIRNAFSQLQVQQGSNDSEPVFTESELEDLAEPLAEALAKAQPEQDVTFAVTGKEGPLFGIFQPRAVTTGRVFYQDGQLNVIFGIVQGEFESQLRATGILRAFTPGSRRNPLAASMPILPGKAMDYATAGREDWIQIRPQAWSEPAGQAQAASPPRPRGSEPPRLAVPARRGEQSDAAAPTPDSRRQHDKNFYDEIEQRLRGLNRLRNLDLITEEEYQEKRRAILDQL